MGETKRRVKQISQLEHVKLKTMFSGSRRKQTLTMYLYDGTQMELCEISVTPALVKIIDEIAVNCIDHWTNYPTKVTEIRITFDEETGCLVYFNDGPGITVEKVTTVNKVEMYAPQMIASEFLSGDNLDENAERKTGGTNGAGLKLTNAYSEYMLLETKDAASGIIYTQRFEDRLNIVKPPQLTACEKADMGKGYTRIEFKPSYAAMGYTKGYSKKRDGETLRCIVQTRALQIAAFTTCKVSFNSQQLHDVLGMDRFRGFSRMFTGSKSAHLRLVSADSKYRDCPFDVYIGVSDGKQRDVSLINGIYVYAGGTHIKFVRNLITSILREKFEKEIKKVKGTFNSNHITNNLFIVFKGYVHDPEFSSQIKDKLASPIDIFSTYTVEGSDCVPKLWELLGPHIMGTFIDVIATKEKKRVTRGRVVVPKCEDARLAGDRRRAHECKLFICEGDSAQGIVHSAIVDRNVGLGGYERYGTFSIQGVPMNARKEIGIIQDKRTGKTKKILKEKLKNNERLSSLVKVLGLDYSKSYAAGAAGADGADDAGADGADDAGADDAGADGDAEFATLRYGGVILTTDQDEDGKGNISGLLINFFATFWPGLFRRGFITRLNTPILRCFPNNKKNIIKEFYSIPDFEKWKLQTFGENHAGDAAYKKIYKAPSYCKGLGTHKKQFIPRMFKNLSTKLVTIMWDDDAENSVETYYGHASGPRKDALRTPVDMDYARNQIISVSEQLNIDTKSYMRDNILRKLPHLMDGLNPAKRCLLFGALRIFSQSNKEKKLDGFVNEVCGITGYHHGSASLCTTAEGMCYGMNLQLLYDDGQFGTAKEGGADAASPRYTETHLNSKLVNTLYPDADFYLLPQLAVESVSIPKWYAPIIPPIYETINIPSTGWKVDMFARDINEILNHTKDMIEGKIKKYPPMRLWKCKCKSEIRVVDRKVWSVGKYLWDDKKNTITIVQLPLLTCSSMYVGSRAVDKKGKHGRHSLLRKDVFVGHPIDNTSDSGVEIILELDPEKTKTIVEEWGDENFDCWELYLGLRTCLTNHINMIGVDGAVHEYKRYETVADDWFAVRRDMYAKRINREIIIKKLKIMCLENIARFVKNHKSYNITTRTTSAEFVQILTDNKFQTFNVHLMDNPKFTPIEVLEDLVLRGPKSSYDYLELLSYRNMIEEACKKRAEELKLLKEELVLLEEDNITDDDGAFPGQNTWLMELEELTKVIALGMRLGWRYGAEAQDRFE